MIALCVFCSYCVPVSSQSLNVSSWNRSFTTSSSNWDMLSNVERGSRSVVSSASRDSPTFCASAATPSGTVVLRPMRIFFPNAFEDDGGETRALLLNIVAALLFNSARPSTLNSLASSSASE